MRTCLVVAALTLAGCVSPAKYARMVQGWTGASEAALVRSWGPPTNSYEAGGSRFLSYSWTDRQDVPGVAPTYRTTVNGGVARSSPVGGLPAYTVETACITTFEVVNGVVASSTFRGNGCAM